MPLLAWAIVASGLSAVFFWKKANPGKSLNPTKADSPPPVRSNP
jgi:hypothetical protein